MYKRKLPMQTFDSTEHPVLAGCFADIDQTSNRFYFVKYENCYQTSICTVFRTLFNVLAIYCQEPLCLTSCGLIFSGDVFVGRRGKDKNGHGMNMYGHFIVKAVFLQLIEDYRINKPETKV